MAVTEGTSQRLRYAETNLRAIAERMAEEPDPTVRTITRHVLRDLGEVGREIAVTLDEAAGAALAARYGHTLAGTAALVAAGLARNHAALRAGRPDASVPA